MKEGRNLHLLVLAPFRTNLPEGGKLLIEKRFLKGVNCFLRYWPGALTVLIQAGEIKINSPACALVNPADLAFSLFTVRDFKKNSVVGKIKESSLVLATTMHQQNHISILCRRAGAKSVYIAEYTPAAKHQIVDCETGNPLLRIRRHLWLFKDEARAVKTLTQADGLQCNGIPAYKHYGGMNADTLLYFDNRVTAETAVTEEKIDKRDEGGPLKLVFFGRLIMMKGAEQLIGIARELRCLGVNFELSICGSGKLGPSLKSAIRRYRLEGCVKMPGFLDFEAALIPLLKNRCDLFIAPHPQGDPSCSYFEAMLCGASIVGYANENLVSITEASSAGWPVAVNRPRLLARKIKELSANRKAIKENAKQALRFALEHTFEKAFKRRAAHLQRIALQEV